MKKPKNENIAKNIPVAATSVKGNAGTPAFAKIQNINLPNRNGSKPGGLSALIGGTRRADGSIGNNLVGASFGSGGTSGKRQIENDPNFSKQSDAAWRASNPDGPKHKKREVGFYAVARWVTGLRPTVTVYELQFGEFGENSITVGDNVMFNTAHVRDDEILIEFHTHPFTSEEGFRPRVVSQDEARLPPHVAGVIRHHGGHRWFGKFI